MGTRVLGEIRRIGVCIPSVFEDMFVVDRVEFNAPPTIFRQPVDTISIATSETAGSVVPGAYEVHFSQAALVRVATLSDLEQNGDAWSSPEGFDVHLVFRLRFGKANGLARFRIEYHHIELDALANILPDPTAVQTQVDAAIGTAGTSPWQDLPVGQLSELMEAAGLLKAGEEPRISNLGAAVTAGTGEMLVLRVELNGPHEDPLGTWTAFYAADFPLDLPSGVEWEVFLHRDLLLGALRSAFKSALDEAEAKNEFLPAAWLPQPTWHPGTPFLRQTFSGEIPEACLMVWGGLIPTLIDLDVDVTVDISFGVPSPNRIRVTTKVFTDINDAEVFACALSGAAFFPIVGTYLATQGHWDLALGGFFAGPIGVFIGAIAVAGDPPLGQLVEVLGGQEISNTDADLELRDEFDLEQLPVGMELTSIAGSAEGLSLRGTLPAPPGAEHPAQLTVEISDDKFTWAWHDLCDSPKYAASARIRYRNTLPTALPHTPLNVCRVEVIEDPNNRYAPYIQVAWDAANEVGEITFSVPYNASQSVGPSYDCKVLLVSSGGARVFTIGAFDAVSQQEFEASKALWAAWAAIFCQMWADVKNAHFYDPLWDIDPVPEGILEIQERLIVSLTEAPPEATLVIRDSADNEIGSAIADPSGQALVTAVIDRTEAPGLSVGVVAPKVSGVEPYPREAPMGKIGIVHIDCALETIDVGGRVLHLSLARPRGTPLLYAVTADRLVGFDVARPGNPRRVQMIEATDCTGFSPLLDGGLLWGPGGARFVSLEGRSAQRIVTREKVIAGASLRGRLYLLHGRRLTEVDRNLSVRMLQLDRPFRSMATVRDWLVLVGQDALVSITVGRKSGLKVVSVSRAPGIEDLRSIAGFSGKEETLLATFSKGPAQAFTCSAEGEVAPSGRHNKVPKLLTATRVGSFQAYIGGKGDVVLARAFGGGPMNQHEIEGRGPIDTSIFPETWNAHASAAGTRHGAMNRRHS